MRRWLWFWMAIGSCWLWPDLAVAATKKAQKYSALNTLWVLLSAFLVFFMQAGFAMVEAGFTRAKNAINILMKNLMDFSIGTMAFFFVVFNICKFFILNFNFTITTLGNMVRV